MSNVDTIGGLNNPWCEKVLRDAAQSENTKIAYEKGWRCFVDWCQSNDLTAQEAEVGDVVKFLIAMASGESRGGGKPLALNTLRLYRSGLNNQWRKMGLPSPASESLVDEVLQGLARLRVGLPRRVKALREHQILAMIDSCSSSLHGLRDSAILALGFAAALRRSELCFLQVEDLEHRGTGEMIVNVRQSKTDVQGMGQKVAVIEGNSIKAIGTVERWLGASKITESFIFQTLQKGGVASGRSLDPGDVARIVKRYVKKIGLDPREYSGHSLRAGFVTSAAVHHARIDKIMEVTRHRNAQTVLKYIRDEESFVDHAGASFL